MKLPQSILSHLRGPLVAATLAGCAQSPAEPPRAPIEPVAEPATEVVAAPDPVSYEAELERERLARLDRERAAEEHRRERRIADAEPRDPWGGLGSIGSSHRRQQWIGVACGRG